MNPTIISHCLPIPPSPPDTSARGYKLYVVIAAESESMPSVVPRIVHISLKKEEGSLGLTLRGGVHPDPLLCRPLVITYVRPGGPAHREFLLCVVGIPEFTSLCKNTSLHCYASDGQLAHKKYEYKLGTSPINLLCCDRKGKVPGDCSKHYHEKLHPQLRQAGPPGSKRTHQVTHPLPLANPHIATEENPPPQINPRGATGGTAQ
uniref:Uncharacterized protein n=1 Tax=Timema shepardi TaxID=629360 RepID=A0A7R9G4K2_TIMSH|nr:unnamed protein product [Timema shepardi]